MSDLDERIRRAMEGATAPADPAGAYERVTRKRAHRRAVRRVQAIGLTVAVVIVSSGVTFTLGRMFGSDRRMETLETPSPPLALPDIAFAGEVEGQPGIYGMNADGSEPELLTKDPGRRIDPSWSPDGTKLAYSDFDDDLDVYVLDLATGEEHQVTDNPADDSSPAWSPDGTSIAFVTTRDGDTDVYLMNADGTAQRRLTDHTASDFDPAWSPDGTRLFFSRDPHDGEEEADIWVLGVEDEAPVPVVGGPGNQRQPAPSPDGTRVAFVSSRDNVSQIFVANADGSAVRLVTDGPANKSNPSWSPDNRRIVFSAEGENKNDLFVVNADGTGMRPISELPGDDVTPAWNPRSGSPSQEDEGSEDQAQGRCLSEAEAAADPSLRTPGSLRGDVDGDGLDDEVFVAIDPQTEEPTCRYFLVVETGSATRVTRIDLTYVEGTSDDLVAVQSLAEIDGLGGLEIFVHMQSGAATEFGQIYTMSGGVLALAVRTDPDGGNALFSFAGSLSGITGFDCTGKAGIIVVSGAHPGRGGWVVERRYYRLEGSEFRIYEQSEHHRLSDRELETSPLEERFPEFGGDPLDDCPEFVSGP